MSWAYERDLAGIVLFAGFFILYGLEFIIPLIRKRSGHLFLNLGFALVLMGVNFLFASTTIAFGEWVATRELGIFNTLQPGTGWMIFWSLIFLDFWAGYLVHCFLHRFPWLWSIHSIHHSDDMVDVTTTFRQHPAETMIRIVFQLSGMAMLGIPVWALMLYLTISTINAQIEHANIRIPDQVDKLLQYIIVTPNMHKVHHSSRQLETDSNYSNIFSFWDRMFFTYRALANYAVIDYGLDYMKDKNHHSFWGLLRLPFRKVNSAAPSNERPPASTHPDNEIISR